VLSGLRPVAALKEQVAGNGPGGRLRKLLVVAQFATCLLLLTATAVVYGQLHYMQTRNLGMAINQLVILNTGGALGNTSPEDAQKIVAFRTELLRDPSMRDVAASGIVPGEAPRTNIGLIRRVESPPDEQNSIGFFYADEYFIPTYQLKLLAGRTFRPTDHYQDPEGIAHNKGVVLNYAALKALGFRSPQEALGKFIYCIPGPRVTPVIGVVENFHQQSLQLAVVPIVIQYLPPQDLGYQSVKVSTRDLPQTLRRLETTWKAFFPGIPFEYTFLDDHFNRQYRSERRFRDVFGAFAGLALLVACLGLFGLSLFATTRRAREVGIRKVLGASPASLVRLLTADFAKPVIVANLLVWPVASWATQQWLSNYAFRMEPSVRLFVLPSLLVLGIALLTVSVQTFKAARANPVHSLRSE
jgi:putative ABC transport system permease protein